MFSNNLPPWRLSYPVLILSTLTICLNCKEIKFFSTTGEAAYGVESNIKDFITLANDPNSNLPKESFKMYHYFQFPITNISTILRT